MYERYFKRPLDFVLSLISLIVLSPILLIIALLVRLKLGSPVLFKQERPGLNEEIFTMNKFRSMTDETDSKGQLLPDKERITNFGKFLRDSSLDELPGLINIVKGNMSIVGPRPLLVKYLPLYDANQRKRHNARPGLTGYAQVFGRNSLDWEERFEYDVHYVENIDFLTDLKIILRTITTVMKKENIEASNTKQYTMKEFTGNEGNDI